MGGYSSRGGRRIETFNNPIYQPEWRQLSCKLWDGSPEFDQVSTDGTNFLVHMKESLRGREMEILDRMYDYGGEQKKTALLLGYAMRRGKASVKYV